MLCSEPLVVILIYCWGSACSIGVKKTDATVKLNERKHFHSVPPEVSVASLNLHHYIIGQIHLYFLRSYSVSITVFQMLIHWVAFTAVFSSSSLVSSLLFGILPPLQNDAVLCKKAHFLFTLKIVQRIRVLFSQPSETLKLAAPVGQSPTSLPSNKQRDEHRELTSLKKR